jgi:hypothetical protein
MSAGEVCGTKSYAQMMLQGHELPFSQWHTHTYTHTHIHTRTHTCRHTHTRRHACRHTHTHTHAHAHAHTHTHAQVAKRKLGLFVDTVDPDALGDISNGHRIRVMVL